MAVSTRAARRVLVQVQCCSGAVVQCAHASAARRIERKISHHGLADPEGALDKQSIRHPYPHNRLRTGEGVHHQSCCDWVTQGLAG